MTATEDAIADLISSTTELLDAVNFSKISLQTDISAAVVISENASQVPLVDIATNMITTQAMFVNYITGGN
jgi:hypothetical protein